MSWFRDMRLRWKLLSSFGALLMLMVAVGGVGLWCARALTDNIHDIAELELTAVVKVLDTQEAIRTIQRDVRQALLVDGAEPVRAAHASVEASRKRVATDLADLDRLLYLPAGQAKLVTVKRAYADWSVHVEKIVDLEARGDREGARAEIFHPDTVKSLAAIDAAIADLAEFKKTRATTVVNEAQDTARFSTAAIVSTVIVAVVLGLGIAVFLARGIVMTVTSIQRTLTSLSDNCATWLADALRAVADGNLTVKLTPVTPLIERCSKDELGQLGTTTNALRNKIVACMGAYEAGRSGLQEIVLEVRTAAGGVAGTSQQLGAASGQTAAVVQQVAQAVQNVASGAQETSRSAQSSNEAVDQLAQVIDNGRVSSLVPESEKGTDGSGALLASSRPGPIGYRERSGRHS